MDRLSCLFILCVSFLVACSGGRNVPVDGSPGVSEDSWTEDIENTMTKDRGIPERPSCSPGQTSCGTSCVDLTTDTKNCGDCAVACDAAKGLTCTKGQCVCAAANQTTCDGECVDTLVDARHCGECGFACNGNPYCSGVCVDGNCYGGCVAPLCVCDGMCVDNSSDEDHCGACGAACDVGNGFVCIGGQCKCLVGFVDCGGECVDLLTNSKHCGACGNNCNPTINPYCPQQQSWVCWDAECSHDTCSEYSCQCDGGCHDLALDDEHCGACGNACTGGQMCEEGKCVCPGTQTKCDGACVDTLSDPLHCGDCGKPCNGGQCVAGKCEP